MTKRKKCSRCKIIKSLFDFYRSKNRKDGRAVWCKRCSKEYQKEWLKNSQKHKEWKEWYNKYRKPDMDRNRYRKNKEKFKTQAKKWQKDNREKINIHARNRRKTDMQYKLKGTLRRRLHSALKNNKKPGSHIKDLGCSVRKLKKYLESLFQPGMTWKNWGRGKGFWQLDHVIPLSSFDLTDREQLLKACHYTNLQPLWYKEHIKKTAIERVNR